MTPLRQRFLDELTRRNYSPRTLEAYLAALVHFSRHFQRSPDQLGEEHIRSFQLHLIQHDRVSWSAFNQIVCALRFFYSHVLQQPQLVPFIPYGKKPQTLPTILSVAQVQLLLEAFGYPPTRMLFRTVYACGLRISEIIGLRHTLPHVACVPGSFAPREHHLVALWPLECVGAETEQNRLDDRCVVEERV